MRSKPGLLLYRIVLPFAVFGIECEAGKVVKAAPIARWALGRDAASVLGYYHRRKAVIEVLGYD